MKAENIKRLSELKKGDLFIFGSQKSYNVFMSSFDDTMSNEFKYCDNMGFEMVSNENVYVKVV